MRVFSSFLCFLLVALPLLKVEASPQLALVAGGAVLVQKPFSLSFRVSF